MKKVLEPRGLDLKTRVFTSYSISLALFFSVTMFSTACCGLSNKATKADNLFVHMHHICQKFGTPSEETHFSFEVRENMITLIALTTIAKIAR